MSAVVQWFGLFLLLWIAFVLTVFTALIWDTRRQERADDEWRRGR